MTRSLARIVRSAMLCGLMGAAACQEEIDVPVDYPVRKVVPHAIVSNGRAPGTLDDHGPITIHIFDGPVSCDALPRGAFAPVPPGVRLEVVIYPARWEPGSSSSSMGQSALLGGLYPTSYDAQGHAEDLAFSSVRFDLFEGTSDVPVFELVSAPKGQGSQARARLNTRIAFYHRTDDRSSDHDGALVRVDEIADEFDVEVCGDIAWPPKPYGG